MPVVKRIRFVNFVECYDYLTRKVRAEIFFATRRVVNYVDKMFCQSKVATNMAASTMYNLAMNPFYEDILQEEQEALDAAQENTVANKINAKIDSVKETAKVIGEAVTEKATVLGQELKEKMIHFSLDAYDHLKNVSVQDFMNMLSQLKPLNLALILTNYVTAQSTSEKFAVLMCLFELVGDFWSTTILTYKNAILFALISILDFILKKCWSSTRDLFGWDMEYMQTQSIEIEEDGILNKVLNFVGIEKESLKMTEEHSFLVTIVLVLFMIVTGGALTSLTEFSVSKIIKRLNKVSSSVKSVHNLQEYLPQVWDNCLDSLGSLLGFNHITKDKEVLDFTQDLINFKNEVLEYQKVIKHEPWKMLQDPTRLKDIEESFKKVDEMYIRLMKFKKRNMSSTKHLFDEIRDVVKNLRDYVLKVKNANVAKQEPFLFILGGKPGIGKSCVIQEISKRVAERCGLENTSYTRNSAVKHWDNYVGQTWIFYDDFGALKTDLDHGDIMSIKNPAKTIVPMADLQDKGTQISSVGVFCAANETETLSSQVVKSSEALDRRFEIRITAVDPYWETFRQQHKCSPGDYEKRERKPAMQVLEDGTEIPYYDKENYTHLQFFLAPSYLCKEEPATEITLDRAIELCCNLYLSYMEKFQASITLPVIDRFETTPQYVMEQINGMYTITKQNVDNNGTPVPDEDQTLNTEIVNDGASTSTASVDSTRRKRLTYDEVFEQVRTDRVNRIIDTNRHQETEKRLLKGKLDPQQYIKGGITWDANFITKDYKKQFLADMMNNHHMSRKQAELEYQKHHMKSQSKPEQPFVDLDKKKNKIILFFGDPGTGKSVTQAALAKHFGKEVIHGSELTERALPPGLVFLEDVSIDEASFVAFEQYVCKVYDGQSHITGICASLNPNISNKWLKTPEQYNRFWRRVEAFEYTWAIKKKNFFTKDEKFNAYDLETLQVPHATCVLIRGTHFTGRLDMTQVLNRCQEELASCKNEILPIAINVPYIGVNDIDPQFIVEFDKPMEEAFEAYYDNPMKMVKDIALSKVRLTKGAVAEGITIARQFNFTDGNEKIKWPGSLDQFIVMVNNSGCLSERVFSTQINASDCKLLITPLNTDPKKIVMFRLAEDVVLDKENHVLSGADGEIEMNPATQRVYQDTLICKPMAEKLAEKTEELTEAISTNINVKTLLDTMPFFKNVSGIMIFIMNLVIAGASISALFSAAKVRFQKMPKPMQIEARGKNKLASRTRNFHVSQQLYNDIKSSVVRNNPSAKDAKVKDLVDYYLDYWEQQDCTGYDTSEYELRPDEIGLFYKDAKFHSETREEKVVVNKPQLVTVMTPYNLECCPYKKIKNYPQLESDTPVYDYTRGKKTVKISKKKKLEKAVEMQSESLFDKELRDMVALARKNDVEILKQGNVICHGLMIQGRVGATVGHCFSLEDEKECSLKVRVYNEAIPKVYPIQVLHKYTALDVVVFKILSNKCNSFRSIRSHLQKKRTTTLLDIVENRKAVLVISEHKDNSHSILPLKMEGQKEVKTDHGIFDGFNYVNPVTVLTGMKTISPINTQFGDCGSPIIANDPTVTQKILGIHNAGADFVAHGSFLFQDMFEEEFFTESRKIKAHLNPHHELDLIEDSRETLLGMPVVAEGNLQVHHPDSTQLWTSPLALPDKQNFQPSILSAYDVRNPDHDDPFYASVGKWNNPQPAIDEALLDSCIDDIGFWYAQKIHIKKYQTKVLTKTEAINSGKNYNVMPINRKSAAGYPWSKYGKKENFLVNKGTGNEAYYGIDLTKKCGQKLNASIDYLINIARKDGEHVKVPFAGCLKDEPVKMSKIETVNTRSFAGAPFDYTIAYRMYFATIYGAIHEVRDQMPIQVGINPTSLEWHFMTKRLLSCSDSGFDLDFKGFDAKVPALIQRKLVEIHNTIARENDPNWTHEDDIIRRGLHEALVKPMIVVPIDNKTYVVQAPGGQPSGHPGTADDNSLIHLVYLLYAYKKVMIARGHEELATLMHFEDKVQAIIYGDDGVYMVHPDIQEYFNFETVEVVMKELGNECTPAAKNGKIQKIIKLTECEFLKRDFVRKGTYWFGALKEKSFEKMLGYCMGPSHQWYRERRPYFGRPEDLKATADACLTEAVIHGRFFFDTMRTHIVQCFRKYNIEYFAYRYEDVVARLGMPLPL